MELNFIVKSYVFAKIVISYFVLVTTESYLCEELNLFLKFAMWWSGKCLIATNTGIH